MLDVTQIESLDSDNMLGHIVSLPSQITQAWNHGMKLPLPEVSNISNIVILGMGGSAIGGSLLQTLVGPECKVPILSNRDYEIPYFVGPNSLVIALSYSGNTEETLTALESAQKQKAQVVSISTGGQISTLTQENNGLSWVYDYKSQPRAALGYSLILPLVLLHRIGLARDFSADIAETQNILTDQNSQLGAQSSLATNPAKRLAGQMLERIILVFAPEPLTPVARRWRGQIAENSKAWAQYEELPEMNHNSVVGIDRPESFIDKAFVLFMNSPASHSRNQRRIDLTRQLFLGSGYNTDCVTAQGKSRMAQMLSMVHYGDYVSFYLSIAYGIDPTPVQNIAWLKENLAESST